MADRHTVVVTGYGPWAKTRTNPAAQVLQRLEAMSWTNCRFVPIEVPVRSAAIMPLVNDALLTHRPSIFLGLGVAPNAAAIRAEMVGINCLDFDVADNDGLSFDGARIVEGGDAAYFATLANQEIVAAIQEAGVPAILSYAAGTHLCNQMLYTSLHLIAQHKLGTRCGFIHVPYAPDHTAEIAKTGCVPPSMSLTDMTMAARIAIERSLALLGTA